jgi:hypothetical protein
VTSTFAGFAAFIAMFFAPQTKTLAQLHWLT